MPHHIHQAAKDYADKTYGHPEQWTPITGITEERFNMNIQDAYLAGYNSRDIEVSNLRGQIKYLEEDKHPKEIKELITLLNDIYSAEEAVTINYAQNGWTYQRPKWFFAAKELLKKYPRP